ncbi:MAG: hypothetical protein H6739_27535 [Alphaproteobacteria bacterium]|nr:hypothetical protein [Alphaproteobacteria bacterium]
MNAKTFLLVCAAFGAATPAAGSVWTGNPGEGHLVLQLEADVALAPVAMIHLAGCDGAVSLVDVDQLVPLADPWTVEAPSGPLCGATLVLFGPVLIGAGDDLTLVMIGSVALSPDASGEALVGWLPDGTRLTAQRP